MNAEIVSIGNEVVGGAVADTNAAWLARELESLGICVERHTAARDELAQIKDVLAGACERADAVLVTGGLGPTPDDLTREALAELTGRPLVRHPEGEAKLLGFYRARGRDPHPSNLKQATLPEGAQAMVNDRGTATGFICTHTGARVYVMPGVPTEMKGMFDDCIRPALRTQAHGSAAALREIVLFGVPESDVGGTLHDMMQRGANPEVGTMAQMGTITVRIVGRGDTHDTATQCADDTAATVCNLFGDHVVSHAGETMAEVVARMLLESETTLALAESCTGGMVAEMLTAVPGISAALLEGIVSYSNAAKINRLGVPEALIAKHGAVSRPVAEAMAAGVRQRSGADIGVGITGIAGPGGAVPAQEGRPEKPVGLVHLACADKNGIVVQEQRFPGDRRRVRTRAALTALNMVRLRLMEG